MLRTDGPLGRLASLSVRRAGWMILLWVAIAGVMNVAVPQLEEVVKNDNTAFVPQRAEAIAGQRAMEEEFGSGKTHSYVYLVMERDGGLTEADTAYYRDVVQRLRDVEPVTAINDMSGDPRTFRSVTSEDGEARYLIVGLSGQTGAPSGTHQVDEVRDVVREGVPDGLEIEVTGTSATIADTSHEIESKLILITIATVIMIAAILQFFYRSFVVTLMGLTMIGLSLAAARAFTAWFGLHVFAISTFTGSFITGVVVGAGTDYFIFTLSRYYDQRRMGMGPREAAHIGAAKIAPVIIGSGITVILANAAAIVADIAFFRTTGPAISVAIAVTLAISLMVSPALISLAARRGLLEPPAERANSYWARSASRVLRAPALMFAAGLLPLLALAAFVPFIELEYDQTRNQPDSSESNRGYQIIADHFPVDEVVPEFLVIRSKTDMRTTDGLAALEQMAQDVAKVDGVREVRGVTRPNGEQITEASISDQAGEVGKRLDDGAAKVKAGEKDADRLAAGAGQLSGGARDLADGAGAAVVGAQQLLDGLGELRTGVGQLDAGASDAAAGSQQLRVATDQLADGLEFAASQTQVAVDGLGQVYTALQSDPLCTLDPICKRAREGLRQIYVGERDQLLPGLREAASAARQIADGTVELSTGLQRLDDGLADARVGVDQLAAGQGELQNGLDALAAGAGELADGSKQVEGGTKQSAEAIKQIRTGMEAAAAYLRQLSTAGGSPSAGGFFVPTAFLDSADFSVTSGLLLSEDGMTARYMVLGDDWPFTRAAMERAANVIDTAENSLKATSLADAELLATGQAAFNHDLARMSNADFLRTAIVALITVLVILLLLLRAPLAALFLVGTVILSFGAAVGIGVLIWQELLGTPIDWTMPTIAFILLVAVGADYNLLLMKRAQEFVDVGYDARTGIASAVASTGSVITTAGIIFAASMFALVAGNITALSQMGTIVGIGLLLDTFVVRTLLVPAGAAIIGERLWWPHKPPNDASAVGRNGEGENHEGDGERGHPEHVEALAADAEHAFVR